MRLNNLKPATGSKTKGVRLGRGMGSGLGKTCGHGHKGQKARSGYSRKIGFEGGQTPLRRRLPKFGFNSNVMIDRDEVRLQNLNAVEADRIDLASIKKAKLVSNEVKSVKIILAGTIERAVTIVGDGIKVTKGASQAIVKAGGKIEL